MIDLGSEVIVLRNKLIEADALLASQDEHIAGLMVQIESLNEKHRVYVAWVSQVVGHG